ncbi:MAG: glycine dehydrogenase [Polaribacter sp.]|jgi:glycine dehydrogenase
MSNFPAYDQFNKRHIGINEGDLAEMLTTVKAKTLDHLIDETVPQNIRLKKDLNLPEAMTEYDYLQELKETASLNKDFHSLIGLGYYGTITPSVLLRNIFQNPGWYTQYTPYQAEIAQGRLEALLNYQTMLSDLTGLPIANASLLDEGTAAAEAMAMFYALKNKRAKTAEDTANEFFVADGVFNHTVDILITRAKPLNIKIVRGDWKKYNFSDKTFGVLLQYPAQNGAVEDYRAFAEKAAAKKVYVTVAADLLSLALLTPPGEWGADAVVGNTQRFGVPMGNGGPHAAYFTTKDSFKRQIPGRIIGVSVDRFGNRALRMALQTREQHIRREKATSNICTAQALLAIMAGMYAAYHGPAGIKAIAQRTHSMAQALNNAVKKIGFSQQNTYFFDTVSVEVTKGQLSAIKKAALKACFNFTYTSTTVQISLDETVSEKELLEIINIFAKAKKYKQYTKVAAPKGTKFPKRLIRSSEYLTHPVFNKYHTETEMMRYLKSLENKDLSLMHSMIPLGSCTMKLNAATQLIPVSWSEFANVHPFAPQNQMKGYHQIFTELEAYLSEITGFTACSLQPNSGAQGEYTGLLTINAYHESRKEAHRNIALIPSSAHGTNPASAVMAGMKVVVVACDERGNIDVKDLKAKAKEHKKNLAALMVTYPSTHGVFEKAIKEICKIVHDNGGLVYMDGANMNAQVGLTSPGAIDADVCHLNLHKTFSIPHGGGGPGMGPICVNDKLAPFLPGHSLHKTGGSQATSAVSSAPWGSASILLISYAYVKMLGREGVTKSTKYAILNANYIMARLEKEYSVLYLGEKGRAAHELILDLRPFKSLVSAEDVAKRLIDYGFHAPTLSFPVAGTIMIEPTESEGKEELDRFCEAMLSIKKEIDEIANGTADAKNNVLVNAPHTLGQITADEWNLPYSREKAAYPLAWLKHQHKFWTTSGRVDNAHGDRNLICTCPPMEAYEA